MKRYKIKEHIFEGQKYFVICKRWFFFWQRRETWIRKEFAQSRMKALEDRK